MKREIEEQLENNAVKLLEFVEKSSEFVIEQAPLYVQELIQFHFWSNALTLVIVFLLMVVLIIAISINYKVYKNSKDTFKDFTWFLPSLILGLIILIPSAIEGKRSATECIKAKYAPRVLIIEKLRGN